jgi:RND family efflux transporter MFP subunit
MRQSTGTAVLLGKSIFTGRPRGVIVHSAAAGVVFLLLGCGQDNRFVPPPPPKVAVQLPARQDVTYYVEATGSVAAINMTKLVARVQGYVQEIKYQDGAVVKKGTPLFVIEPEPYHVKLQQAKAAEAGSKAALVNSEAEFQRQLELQSKDVSTQANLDKARAGRDTGAANLQQAQANTRAAEIDFGYTTVGAPFDGYVTARQVSVGELVGGDQPSELASIVQLDPIWIWFNLSETQVHKVRAEMRALGLSIADFIGKSAVEAALQTDREYPHKGVLDYTDPLINPSTGTLRLRGVFANPARALLPGNFVRVRVPFQPRSSLLVPEIAVGSDQSGRYVLVVDANNVVQQRSVELAHSVGTMRVVASGLEPEERVIVSGLLDAVPGQKVEPQLRQAELPVPATSK